MQKKPDQGLIEAIRKAVQQRMSELQLSQAQLADEAGISRSALNELFKKTRLPGCAVLIKLADRLDLSLDDLVGRRRKELDEVLGDAGIRELLVSLAGRSPGERAEILRFFQESLEKRNVSTE